MNPTLEPNQYECAICHGVFEKGWTDEEARAEKERMFGDIPDEDCQLVCDP